MHVYTLFNDNGKALVPKRLPNNATRENLRFPKISLKVENIIFIPTTDGSRSMNMARGTCFPLLVSLKNVLNELSAIPMEVSEGMIPSF